MKNEGGEEVAEVKVEAHRGRFTKLKERSHFHNSKVQSEAASVNVEAVTSY